MEVTTRGNVIMRVKRREELELTEEQVVKEICIWKNIMKVSCMTKFLMSLFAR